jgi:phage terminase large subunit-like protein
MSWDAALVPLRDVARRKHITLADARALVDALPDRDVDSFRALWPWWEFAGQTEPPGDWTVWLMMAGRGYGKTRSGAGWLVERVMEGGAGTNVALVGPTANAVRSVMVEGESGLLAACSEAQRSVWEPTLGRLLWPSAARAAVPLCLVRRGGGLA